MGVVVVCLNAPNKLGGGSTNTTNVWPHVCVFAKIFALTCFVQSARARPSPLLVAVATTLRSRRSTNTGFCCCCCVAAWQVLLRYISLCICYSFGAVCLIILCGAAAAAWLWYPRLRICVVFSATVCCLSALPRPRVDVSLFCMRAQHRGVGVGDAHVEDLVAAAAAGVFEAGHFDRRITPQTVAINEQQRQTRFYMYIISH